MPLVLFDDARARAFEPFALTRPMSEMRAGALLIRQRWARVAGEPASGIATAPHLAPFEEFDAPPVMTDIIPSGAILANARCLPRLDGRLGADATLWRCGARIAALRLPRPMHASELDGGNMSLDVLAPSLRLGDRAAAEIAGWWVNDPWDLIRDLTTVLASDIGILGPECAPEPSVPEVARRGSHALYVEAGAEIEPQVYVDLSAGPVLVRRGATVQAFTRMIGPLYIGEGSTITTDRIAASSIGEQCKVHGELSTSVIIGHANKSHDGFVGHSYLGRWVNLGAGTITSNLKNTYGPVQLWTPGGLVNTGMTFIGSMLGDYVKTGIGTRLMTGTVVGAGANIFGGAAPPKFVPPFAWGDGVPYQSFAIDKFIEVAERQMARRSVVLGTRGRQLLRDAYQRGRERWDLST
jgi:UDP-N-acetylglucosamine diphosphorylase/glucosamine-1-phosphate N-acetyltransferase